MAALTTVVVNGRTTSECTITFNAAAITCNGTQLRQLQQLLNRLVVDTPARGGNTSAVITATWPQT